MVAEKEREPEEGEAEKSPSKIVDENLSQISRSSTFLPNIGVPRPSKKGRSSSTAAQAHMQAQFEATLQAEREEAARKQEELQAQLQAQQAALKQNQSLLRQTQEEVKGMHTKFEETNALLRAVLKLQKD
jgi:septal ring factor EnvC (AmiA/AmiB activator)